MSLRFLSAASPTLFCCLCLAQDPSKAPSQGVRNFHAVDGTVVAQHWTDGGNSYFRLSPDGRSFTDPAVADYPMGYSEKPSRSWFQFGYPIAYVTDVLQNLEALTFLGYARDPRLEPALRLVLSKQDAMGRWKMEYTYNGKTWVDIEEKGKPSKWVTLRALRVLKAASD